MGKIDFVNFESTLKICSWDDYNKVHMVENENKVINFDQVKEEYVKNLKKGPCELPCSNDALFKTDDKYYFIEFKNGIIDNKTNAQIKMKVYDSLLILSDIEKMSISDTRESVFYVLVFNDDNIDSNKISKQFNKEEYNRHNQVQPSPNRSLILSCLDDLSGDFGKAQFGMARFENFIFKKVYTIPKFRFENFIEKCICQN